MGSAISTPSGTVTKEMFKEGQKLFILFYRWKKLWIVHNRVHTYICPLQSLMICTVRGCSKKAHQLDTSPQALPEEAGQVTTVMLMKMGPLELVTGRFGTTSSDGS